MVGRWWGDGGMERFSKKEGGRGNIPAGMRVAPSLSNTIWGGDGTMVVLLVIDGLMPSSCWEAKVRLVKEIDYIEGRQRSVPSISALIAGPRAHLVG